MFKVHSSEVILLNNYVTVHDKIYNVFFFFLEKYLPTATVSPKDTFLDLQNFAFINERFN